MKKFFTAFSFFLLGSLLIQAQNENRLIGPASGSGILRSISPNGRYVSGQQAASSGVAQGYVWDSESGNTVTYLGVPGEAFGVTNDKFVVGSFNDSNYQIEGSPLRSGGYWIEGTGWTSLGLGLVTPPPPSINDGTSARAITADGNMIVGASFDYPNGVDSRVLKPYSWTKNGDSWVGATWAHPENLEQGASIISISADGSKAVGWVRVEGSGQREGILWTSQNTYEILFEEQSIYSEYICISSNGKYAGFRSSNGCGVHNIETDQIFIIREGFIINAVSDNGFALGGYRSPAGVDKGFVWSPTLGFMDFGEFVSTFAPGLILPTTPLGAALNINNSSVYSLMAITPDGLSIALQLTAPRVYQAYIIKLGEPIVVLPYPKNLTTSVPVTPRNSVVLNWEAPILDGETLTGYTIYRNGEEVVTVDENALTYTQENTPSGFHNYTIKANYTTGQSRSSNVAEAMVVDTYALPFHESFESGSLQTNFWTTEKILGTINSPAWGGAMSNAGVGEIGYGVDFRANHSNGEYESSLISKYFDGNEATSIYLSYMAKPRYYLDSQLTPDTLYVEVYNGTAWTIINKSYFRPSMEWKAEILDLTEAAAGNYFRIRFRVHGANNSINTKYIYFDDIRVSTTLPEGTAVPRNAIARKSGNNIQLSWQSPTKDMYTLTYANTPKRYSIGNGGENIITVNSFDQEELAIYKDLYLTSITAYINKKVSNPSVATQIKLAVFDGDERIVDQEIESFTPNAWNTFTLDQPILLNNKDLKFGIEVVAHDAAEEPIGADGNRNPITGKGDLYSEDGGLTWQTLTAAGKVNNWCIIGNVSLDDYEGEWDSNIIGYNIYREGVKLNEDIIFGQTFTDEYNEGECYTIRAYSLIDGISEESEEICIVAHEILASSSEGGAISPNGNISVIEGYNQEFSFIPNLGYELTEVLVDDTNIPQAVTDGNYTFENVTEDHTIHTVFERIAGVYLIGVSATSGGSTEPSGVFAVNEGEDKTVSFTADLDYELTSVLVDGVEVPEAVENGSYTFTNVNADHIIHVTFEEIIEEFTITASATTGGSIDPNEEVTVFYGEDETFTFTAETGYRLSEVRVDGQNVPEAVENGNYTFVNVTENHTIHAVFERTVEIDNEETLQLNIYPNPTTGQLYINNGEGNITNIQILDSNGRVIFEENNISNSNVTIDLSNYNSGTYFIKAGDHISKIIK